jgi:hypothetical protein
LAANNWQAINKTKLVAARAWFQRNWLKLARFKTTRLITVILPVRKLFLKCRTHSGLNRLTGIEPL